MTTTVTLPIIGYMRSPYQEKFGIPRQPNLVEVESYIEMIGPYNDLNAFVGIEEFSHLWLLWQFHDNKNQQDSTKFRPQIRPPRLGGNQKIGVFASRSMYRPAPIGLSVVKLKKVEKVGKTVRVYVVGSDLLNGTPLVDIKPYIQYSDAVTDAKSAYAQDEPVRKQVVWLENARISRDELVKKGKINLQTCQELEQVLALDPRPAYQDDPERIYGMSFANLNVRFSVDENQISIHAL
ncbi:tRNA (N6-threonylcarbamoyladenosine(37)-N6)-methyltransferase TrmO [Acinetobacter sp. B51(2017)]|uniref:tRNA (N6-threonylcarbamoyladenosine(37)-N6)-methyltransferase TrmO n=1 Tax=Acinetobacter sp. B51(2017) TaxID=2060938 RepID=UPI000F07404E|nr:tRNA (N6-threonylcarbamoyladenosine(37)-N6)-methyltransferase TrmO [Acinetobacter sp. B51(2017)]